MVSLSPPSTTVYLRLPLGAVFIIPNSTFFSLTSFRNPAVTPSCPASQDLVKPSAAGVHPQRHLAPPAQSTQNILGFQVLHDPGVLLQIAIMVNCFLNISLQNMYFY